MNLIGLGWKNLEDPRLLDLRRKEDRFHYNRHEQRPNVGTKIKRESPVVMDILVKEHKLGETTL